MIAHYCFDLKFSINKISQLFFHASTDYLNVFFGDVHLDLYPFLKWGCYGILSFVDFDVGVFYIP